MLFVCSSVLVVCVGFEAADCLCLDVLLTCLCVLF